MNCIPAQMQHLISALDNELCTIWATVAHHRLWARTTCQLWWRAEYRRGSFERITCHFKSCGSVSPASASSPQPDALVAFACQQRRRVHGEGCLVPICGSDNKDLWFSRGLKAPLDKSCSVRAAWRRSDLHLRLFRKWKKRRRNFNAVKTLQEGQRWGDAAG